VNVRARDREEGGLRSFNGDHDRSAYALNIASVASSKVFSRNFLHRDPIGAGCSLGCFLVRQSNAVSRERLDQTPA
jgi:hypothetical protein